MMTDARQHAIDAANLLNVFTGDRLVTIFEEPFLVAPGMPGSPWQTRRGYQGSVALLPDEIGGVVRVDSGTTMHGNNNWLLGIGGDVPGIIANPGLPGSRWLLEWIFRIPTTPDAQTDTGLVLRSAEYIGSPEQGIWLGVDGLFDDPTRLMCEEDFVNTTLSARTVDPGTWHRARAWQLGVAGEIHFSFDGEDEKILELTQPFLSAVTVGLTCGNGSNVTSSQQLDSDHLVILMDGNAPL